MLDSDVMRNSVEWRQALPQDAETWVSVTRQSADQLHFEMEEAQIERYRSEPPKKQAQRYLLWQGERPIGRLRFYVAEDEEEKTAVLDGFVLLFDAGGSVAVQVAAEAQVRAAALGVRYIKATYPAAYTASFAAANFRELRRRTVMVASTQLTMPLFPLPASLRVREITPADVEQLGILLQRAYAGGPDNVHADLGEWRAEARTLQEGAFGPFMPECCFVVEHSLDRFHLAGAVLVHLERGVPRIRHMVVAPAFRHIGLGQYLGVRCIRRLREMDYATVLLNITLNIPAVNLYHRLGFIEAGPTYVEAERILTR